MVKVNIHQHQKGKPNLSKKIFGPEATLIQCPSLFSLTYIMSYDTIRRKNPEEGNVVAKLCTHKEE